MLDSAINIIGHGSAGDGIQMKKKFSKPTQERALNSMHGGNK